MSGYAPERPRAVLKPRPFWVRASEITSEQIWASPVARTVLWAFICALLFIALRTMRVTGFAPGPLLFAAATLLPPLFFAGIVPARGTPFGRGYLQGLFATAALLPVLAAFAWLNQFGHIAGAIRAAQFW